MSKIEKILSIVGGALWVVLLVLCIVFGCISTKRGKTIKTKEIRIEQLMAERTELMDNIEKLGAETVLSVTCNINIKSTNVMGVNTINSNNIAKEIAQITKKELYDSLYGPKYTLDTIQTKEGATVITGKKHK